MKGYELVAVFVIALGCAAIPFSKLPVQQKTTIINNDTLIVLNYTYYYNSTTQEVYPVETTTIVRPQNELQEVAYDVADDYIYKANVFDCTEFCKELELRLRQRGYSRLEITTVTLDCDNLDMEGYSMDAEGCERFGGRHDILRLGDWGYMECTNGFIIAPKDYGKYGVE